MGEMADYYDDEHSIDPLGWRAVAKGLPRKPRPNYDRIVADTMRRMVDDIAARHNATIFNYPEPEEVPMSTLGPIAGRIARLERELAELRTRVTRYGDDQYPNGTVLTWDKQFSGNSRIYSYVAIKTEVGWVVSTANGSGRTYSWDNLIDHILKDAHLPPVLWRATEWEEVTSEG